jgi:hypothetical protein
MLKAINNSLDCHIANVGIYFIEELISDALDLPNVE